MKMFHGRKVTQCFNVNNILFLYAQNRNKNVQHKLKSVPKRATLKVASHLWESPPWQLAFTRPQLAEWQDTWEPLTHLEAGPLRPEQSGVSITDWFYRVKPIIVGRRCNKYPQRLFPERTLGDKYYEGWN